MEDNRKGSHCLILNDAGIPQKTFSLPPYRWLHLEGENIFVINSLWSSKPGLLQVNWRTKEQRRYPFPKGITTFGVQSDDAVWFLYGKYSENERCSIVDAAAPQKIGCYSLEQLTSALIKVGEKALDQPHQEEITVSAWSEMTKTFDGRVAVYDPKNCLVYNVHTKEKLIIDRGPGKPSDGIICLKDFILPYTLTHIPHDHTSFVTFDVYACQEGWNTYSANVEKVLYTERWNDCIVGSLRVLDENSFVVERDNIQKRPSKFVIEPAGKALAKPKDRPENKKLRAAVR